MTLDKLLSNVGAIHNNYKKQHLESGNAFNVFEIINVTTDEVRLHSKFIAELLNPKGSHGQQDLFLSLFLNQLEISMDTKSTTVDTEKFIGARTATKGGYLDIFLKDAKGNSLTIENKIYASDQENQLIRYHNYSPENLFYLTLFGTPPSNSSIGKLGQEDYKLISYENHIKNWLIQCIEKTKNQPLLTIGITHYLNIIKNLTGQSNYDLMNKEITHAITKNPTNLQHAVAISQNINEAKTEIQWNFWQQIIKHMENLGFNSEEKEKVTKQKVCSYYRYGTKEIDYGYWVKIAKVDQDTDIVFGIVLDNHVYFGLHLERHGKWINSEGDKFKKIQNIVLTTQNNYKENSSWLGWRYPGQKLNFKSFNSAIIFDLADKEKAIKITRDIAEEATLDINTFKKLWTPNSAVTS